MYTISKEFSFSAAHSLRNLPASHPCKRMHGHNYKVILEISGTHLNEAGMLIDYRALDFLKEHLEYKYDHLCLNDVMSENPTAENLAKEIALFCREKLKNQDVKIKVTVCETEKTKASWTED